MATLPLRRARRFFVSVFAGTAALSLLGSPIQTQASPNEPWPAQVSAVYRIGFNGFDIGSFEFNASTHASTYVLSGNAQLSALLGAFQWQGLTRTAGTVQGVTPKPAAYTFDYRSRSMAGSIKMNFDSNQVARVSSTPATAVSGTVPVQSKHMKSVLDPLSAVMVLTKAAGNDPCAHRLPVFDGKQRFDLVLSYAGQTRLPSQSGQPDVGYVCSVRYVPIAGHLPNAQTRKMAQSSGIKIVLRPIPHARLLVPHQIVVPTGAGSATLTAERVTITTSGRDQIALVN